MIIVAFAACAALVWWFTGRLFAPVECGTGICKSCKRLRRLVQFERCRDCHAREIEAFL